MFSLVKGAIAGAAEVFGFCQQEKHEEILKDFDSVMERMQKQATDSTRASEPVQLGMKQELPTISSASLVEYPLMKSLFTQGKDKEALIPKYFVSVYSHSTILQCVVQPIQDKWSHVNGSKKEFGAALKEWIEKRSKTPGITDPQKAEIRAAMLSMVKLHLLPHYPLLQMAFEGKPFTMAQVVSLISEVDNKMLSSIVGSLPTHTSLTSPGDLLRHLLDTGNHRFVIALLGEFGIQCVNQEVGLLDRLVEFGITARINDLRIHGSQRHDCDILAVLPLNAVEGNPTEMSLPQADLRDKHAMKIVMGRDVDFTFVGIHRGKVVASSKGGVNISYFFAILHGLCPMPPKDQFLELIASVLQERIKGFQFLLAIFVGKNLPRLTKPFLPEEYKDVKEIDKKEPSYDAFRKVHDIANKTAKAILQRACDGNATKEDLDILVPLLLENFFREATSEDMVKLCKSLMHIFALMNGEVCWRNIDLVECMSCSEEAKLALTCILDRGKPEEELGALVEFFRQEIPKIPLPTPSK